MESVLIPCLADVLSQALISQKSWVGIIFFRTKQGGIAFYKSLLCTLAFCLRPFFQNADI